jgi:GNAT superfamily N-acetyltransferase
MKVIPVDAAALDGVLDATWPSSRDGLDRQAYGRLDAARMRTAWGRRCQRRFVLVDGGHHLAAAEQYDLTAVLDGKPAAVCAIGSLVTHPEHCGLGHARVLVETLLDRAAQGGAELALFFSSRPRAEQSRPGSGPAPVGLEDAEEDDWRRLFEPIPLTEVTLHVAESPRHGAPMTMVRGGEERDLAAIVAMGRVRAGPIRFHLDRDVDLVQHAITNRRLAAGLGRPDARQLYFFIAEEGITAAAYVVVSVAGEAWTLEECGDRDPSGARVGALLQALIAREAAAGRPVIRGWLPPHFMPPQLTIVPAAPSPAVVMLRSLSGAAPPALSVDDVLFWRSDVF